MQKNSYLAPLCVGFLLIGCNPDKRPPATASGAATANPHSPQPQPGSGGMAGMHRAGPATAQQAAMNRMMAAMDSLPAKGNADYDFARMMRAHHQGAVEMADLELRDGLDPAMRRLAATIKQDQQRELGELASAIARLSAAPATYQPQNSAEPFTHAMNASMEGMMKTVSVPTAGPDLAFNQLMTSHHQSAVAMAQAELRHGTDRQLRDLARQIIGAQQQEIKQLQQWQAQQAGAAQ